MKTLNKASRCTDPSSIAGGALRSLALNPCPRRGQTSQHFPCCPRTSLSWSPSPLPGWPFLPVSIWKMSPALVIYATWDIELPMASFLGLHLSEPDLDLL